jgi:uncharacterized protein (TIGR03435 family)
MRSLLMTAINLRGCEGDVSRLRMRRLQLMCAALCASALAIMCTSTCAQAQDAAANGNGTKPTAAVMAADADPNLDVTTVKPSDPNYKYDYFTTRGRHVVIRNETVLSMLRTAYGLQKSQIAGVPDWVSTERYDVDSVVDGAGEINSDQMHAVMKKLLAERFGLKAHYEQREMAVYALTVAKGGPRMEPSKADPKAMATNAGGEDNGRQTRKFTNVSMADLAPMLQFSTDRPVVDQTGIKGRYDFRMQWTVDDARAMEPDAPPGLFTAIQEQIGLKLAPTKAMADVLVVETVQRPGMN